MDPSGIRGGRPFFAGGTHKATMFDFGFSTPIGFATYRLAFFALIFSGIVASTPEYGAHAEPFVNGIIAFAVLMAITVLSEFIIGDQFRCDVYGGLHAFSLTAALAPSIIMGGLGYDGMFWRIWTIGLIVWQILTMAVDLMVIRRRR